MLKGLILDNFYFGTVWRSLMKDIFFYNFHYGGCGGPERTGFSIIFILGGCGVLQELILGNFYLEWVWWV